MHRLLALITVVGLSVLGGCAPGQQATPRPPEAPTGTATEALAQVPTQTPAAAPTAPPAEPASSPTQTPTAAPTVAPTTAPTQTPAATPTAATLEALSEERLQVGLQLLAEGLTAPVYLAPSPDETGRLFIVDQVGVIRVLTPEGQLREDPFLDLRDRLVGLQPAYDERGLLGLAFHPDYAQNGRFFVYYSAPLRPEAPDGWNHTSHLSEFRVSADDPGRADPDSERILVQIDQPQHNHNGGTLAFGPADGYLYLSLGDGGGANDTGAGHPPTGNGQAITTALGSILRIDVDGGEPYGIPPDNPFVGVEGVDEIFAYGLRNPYRFSFDRGGNHDLFAADAGQNLWEEVSLVTMGGNYGWNIKEGTHCFDPANPNVSPQECPDVGPTGEPLIDPVIEYQNANAPGGIGLAVIGGYVYRGSALPGFEGRYVFGDWSARFFPPAGSLFVATPPASEEGLWTVQALRITTTADGSLGHYVLGFGEDHAGELYVLTTDLPGPTGGTGKVYKLVAP